MLFGLMTSVTGCVRTSVTPELVEFRAEEAGDDAMGKDGYGRAEVEPALQRQDAGLKPGATKVGSETVGEGWAESQRAQHAAPLRNQALARGLVPDGSGYEGVVGLLTKVIAGRFGSGLGTFFFGFFTSRLRASLFPMSDRMPQFRNFATSARVCELERNRAGLISRRHEWGAAKHFEVLRRAAYCPN